MECANIVLSHLAHQEVALKEICTRVVETAYARCRKHGLALSVSLHTAGGDRAMLEGLLAAARERPDIIVGADNVIGDFQLHLPFNSHLWRAARTNPVQVFFDLDGEYWGRNFYPTCALGQYAAHLEEARRLGAECVNGRVSTGHDRRSPHFNVLPTRRVHYPGAVAASFGNRLPPDLEVCCFDTLGGFNAEFFCANAADPAVEPRAAVRTFLKVAFGDVPDELVEAFVDVEGVAARVFYTGHNYFNAQSILPSPKLARFWALDLQLTTPAGEVFVRRDTSREGRAAFEGWPLVVGLRTPGFSALIAEKHQAVADAEDLLSRVTRATGSLAPGDRDFIVRHFTDFVLLARAAAVLIEAMAHWFHLEADMSADGFPDRSRLAELVEAVSELSLEWQRRQPHDEWRVAERLSEWCELISPALGCSS